MSKPMAKWSTGAQVIETPAQRGRGVAAWRRCKRLADKAGVGMPEVAIYEGEPNAFATGAFRNSALVAVSTGLAEFDVARRDRGGARPRGRARRQRRHGDADADPGRGQHLRRVPVARGRRSSSTRMVFRTERGTGPGYFITDDRRPDRVRRAGEHDRRVVLAPARISRRRGQRASAWARRNR